MRKYLFLILTFALIFVPVFLSAHVFTHYGQADEISHTEAVSGYNESADIDIDDICLDCLALAALSFLFIAAGFSLLNQVARLLLAQPKREYESGKKSFTYCSRAPPLLT